MKLLYLTTIDPKSQGDFQEVMILHGLRSLLGDNVIDYPKKKVMYGDYSDTLQTDLHGYGFTLYTQPISDISNRELKDIDFILYGVTNAYGITDNIEINKLTNNIWYLDGHDHSRIQKKPCFKRELFNEEEGVYPTGFGIPSYQIKPLNFNRNKLYQNSAPPFSLFREQLLGLEARKAYIYKNEKNIMMICIIHGLV